MSITLAVQPQSRFMFSRQPIAVEASTDNLVQTAGVKFSRTITFINAPVASGVGFQITWNGITVTMTSQLGTITEDGTRYRAKAIGETLADWIAHFAEDVGFNFYIARDFDITYTTTTFTLTAKETGADYNVTFNDIPGTVTTDYTIGAETTGVTQVLRSNFAIFLDVYLAAGDYVRLQMFRTDKTQTGYYEAQIQRVLHSRISSPFPSMTNVDDVVVLEDGEVLKKYWFRYFEFFGTTAVPSHYYLNTNTGNYYYALMGGHYRDKNQNFLASYTTNFLFLTFQKRTKYVTMDQPEWLYWFIANNEGVYGNLELKIYYTDATSDTVFYPWDISSEDELRAMYKAVGYFQIVAPNADVGKTVERWTIRILPTDEVEPITSGETFTYYPVTDGTPWYKHFVFRNSFGGYDTHRMRGVVATGLDVTSEILNKWLDDDYLPSDGTYTNTEGRNQVSYTATVGFEDEEAMIDYLREIFVNPRAAIVEEDTDADDGSVKVVPVVIEPGSIRIKKSDDMLFSFQFNYKEAFDDKGIPEIVS